MNKKYRPRPLVVYKGIPLRPVLGSDVIIDRPLFDDCAPFTIRLTASNYHVYEFVVYECAVITRHTPLEGRVRIILHDAVLKRN